MVPDIGKCNSDFLHPNGELNKNLLKHLIFQMDPYFY